MRISTLLLERLVMITAVAQASKFQQVTTDPPVNCDLLILFRDNAADDYTSQLTQLLQLRDKVSIFQVVSTQANLQVSSNLQSKEISPRGESR